MAVAVEARVVLASLEVAQLAVEMEQEAVAEKVTKAELAAAEGSVHHKPRSRPSLAYYGDDGRLHFGQQSPMRPHVPLRNTQGMGQLDASRRHSDHAQTAGCTGLRCSGPRSNCDPQRLSLGHLGLGRPIPVSSVRMI